MATINTMSFSGQQLPKGWVYDLLTDMVVPDGSLPKPFMVEYTNKEDKRVPVIRQRGGGAVAERQKHVMLENKPLMAVIGYLLLECGTLNEDKTAVEVMFTQEALESLRYDYTVQWVDDPVLKTTTFRMLLEPQGVTQK